MHLQRTLAKILQWSGISFCALILILTLFFVLLQTGPAKELLSSSLPKILNQEDLRFELSGLEGLIPFHFRLTELIVSDAGGPFLKIDQARLHWSPWKLLSGRLHVLSIGADRLDFQRLPSLPKDSEAEEEAPESSAGALQLPPVRIEQLEVPHIRLGQEVLGESALFSLQGAFDVSSLSSFNCRLELNRLDRQGLSTRLSAGYAEANLNVDWRVQAPGTGILQQLVSPSIPGDLDLRLQGKGALENWQGTLNLDIAETPVLASSLDLQLRGSALDLKTEGSLQVSDFLPPASASLLPEDMPLPFALNLGYVHEQGLVRLKALQLNPDWGELNLEGTADLRTRVLDQDIHLKMMDLSVLEPFLPQPLQGRAEVRARLRGPWALPAANLKLSAKSLQIGEYRADEGWLDLSLKPGQDSQSLSDSLDVSADLQTTAFANSALSLNLEQGRLQFEGSFGRDRGVDIRQLRISIPNQELRVSGEVLSNGTFQANCSGESSALSQLPVQVPLPFTAGLSLEIDCWGNWRTQAVSSRITAQLQELSGLPSDLQVLTGDAPRFSADLNLKAGRVVLEKGRLKGRHLSLDLNGGLGLNSKDLNLVWNLSGPRLEQFGFARQGQIAGPIQARGRLQGSLPALQSELQAEVAQLLLPPLQPCDLKLKLKADHLLSDPLGMAQAELTRPEQQLTLKTDFAFSNQVLSLSRFQVQAPQSGLQGGLDLDLRQKTFQTDLQLQSTDLAWTRSFLHKQPLSGELELQLTGKGPLANPAISAVVQGHELEGFDVGLQEISGKVQLHDLERQDVDLQLRAENLSMGNLLVSKAVCSVTGDRERYQLNLTSSGKAPEAYDLAIEGALSLKESGQYLSLSSGRARYAGVPLNWTSPLRLTMTSAGAQVSASGMVLGQGRLDLSAEMQQESIQARLALAGFDLSSLTLERLPPLQGQASMELLLQGSLQQPELDLKLDLNGLQPVMQELPSLQPLNADLSAVYRDGLLKAGLQAKSLDVVDLDCDGRLPVALALSPFAFEAQDGLKGRAELKADLGELSPYLDLSGQQLGGLLKSDLRLSGSLSRPEVSGTAHLEQGDYQNVNTGTILTQMTMDCTFDQRRIILEQFTAADGQSGRISAKGDLDLSPNNFKVRAELDLDQARLVRLDFLDAQISGAIQMTSSAQDSLLSGQLAIAPIELRIPEAQPQSLEGLRIVRATDQSGLQQEQESKSQDPGQPGFLSSLKLDLALNIPSKCFVRGKGLDSEWSGKFSLGNTAAAPEINGDIQLIRGHINFLTKRFDLEKGTITFLNEVPPKPMLDIRAVTRSGELTIILSISGPSTDPQLLLESEPALPRDEVLAKLLFNKDLRDITAIQAVKLALAVRVLTSGGSGEGIMGTFRKSLGLDELEIKSDAEDGGAVVGMGKYLSDNIYFKVEQGAAQDSTEVSVRIELTPRISLKTSAGSLSQGVEMLWEYNY